MRVLLFIVVLVNLHFQRFRGMNCEVNIDDCDGNSCLNGSTCIDGINSYTCQCPPTYTGRYCEQDVDECELRSDICDNGGTCHNQPGDFLCVCVNGWIGTHCETNKDDCEEIPCFNGGTCHDRIGYYHCECPVGKTATPGELKVKLIEVEFDLDNKLDEHYNDDDKIGLRCHLEDACVRNPCKGVGSICETSPIDGNPICMCRNGWTGHVCETDLNECQEVVDGGKGTICLDGWLAFRGSCYLFGTGNMAFTSAEQFCRQHHNGHLVHVNDTVENAFLKGKMHDMATANWWMGLTDETIEGVWQWFDTDTVTSVTDFVPGDGGHHQDEDCAFFYEAYAFRWADCPCTQTNKRPLCEMPSLTCEEGAIFG